MSNGKNLKKNFDLYQFKAHNKTKEIRHDLFFTSPVTFRVTKNIVTKIGFHFSLSNKVNSRQ